MKYKHFCTYSDSNPNYLPKGIALIKSLIDEMNKHNNTAGAEQHKYRIHYLCLDDEAYDILIKVNDIQEHIILYKLSDFEKNDDTLAQAKQLYQSKYGNNWYMHYCYLFSCYFINMLLETGKVNSGQSLLYVDSDIYFYEDPSLIWDDMEKKSAHIGLLPHLHVHNFNFEFGYYNVGVLYFKNTKFTRKVVDWWKDSVMYGKHPQYATCGDQKYLEGMIELHDPKRENIQDIDSVAHGAPWNLRLYLYDYSLDQNKLVIHNKILPFAFHHFSRMQCDFNTERFSHDSGTYGGFTFNNGVYTMTFVDKIYQNYNKLLNRIYKGIIVPLSQKV